VKVRDAEPGDNTALIALAAQSTMDGDLSLRVDREPDFFALNRLSGDRWRVGVVDCDDAGGSSPIGCIAVARRTVFLDGVPGVIAYVGDLKVHPAYRRRGVARALGRWDLATARELTGPDAPLMGTMLSGNTAVDGLARQFDLVTTPWTTIRSYSVDLLTRRRLPARGLTVHPAGPADEPAMVELWRRLAPTRQFAPACDSFPLGRPGLDYLIARHPDGEPAGFLGLWDQHGIKQMRVVGYSPRLAAARTAFNLAAPLFRAPRLPSPGGRLSYRTVAHPCASDLDTLRALLRHACNRLHGRYSFLTIGLDVRDPLTTALAGLRAQPADVDLLVVGPQNRTAPAHFEIATV